MALDSQFPSVRWTHLAALLCVGGVFACSDSNNPKVATANEISIFGQVQTEAGLPIAGATVCFPAKSACVTTDADGKYATPYDNKIAEPLVVNFQAPGYARRTARLHNATGSQAPMALRQLDKQVTVALPTGTQAAVDVTVVRDDAQSTLSVPADALVDNNGTPAVGNANVRRTFWHPLNPLVSAPGNLVAETDNGGRKSLETYGMADIEVEQNGALLQVAPGKTLGWSIAEPNAVRQALSPNNDVYNALPDLYSLSTTTGLWHLEGTAATGALTFDANTGIIATRLPHLTSWNVDADAGPKWGGCISGRLVDPCGKPVAATDFTVWFLGYEQLKDWTGNRSNDDGTFCVPTYLSSFNVTANRLNINYFISGADSYTNTTMCNPAPASCFNCVDQNPNFSTMGWCSNCFLDPAGIQPAAAGTEPPTYYSNTCNAPSIDLVPYSSCGANNCANVGDIVLASATCGANPPNKTTPAPPPDPCAAGKGKSLGQECAQNDICCPHDSLVCEDELCVPNQDPNIRTTQ
jgi:hypothetical protein